MGSLEEPPASTDSSTIPIVDFLTWTNDSSQHERLAVAKQLTEACREVGFVYIINHGLPQELLDEAFAMSKRLFDLSLEQKMQAPHPDGPDVHRGYSKPGLEKVSQVMGGDDETGEALRQVSDCKVEWSHRDAT